MALPFLTNGSPVSEYMARRLGLFLHFNMCTFSMKDVAGDWASADDDPDLFNPGNTLNTDQWASCAVSANAPYACLTTKHHDGFCLWPSSYSTHNVSASSWYGSHGSPDIVSLFVNSCRSAGIKPCLYFSVLDWSLYSQLSMTEGSPASLLSNQAAYKARIEGQLTELLTNYGDITGVWFDGAEWNYLQYAPTLPSCYPWDTPGQRRDFLYSLQRRCVFVNNCHTGSFRDSDILTFEASFPAEAPAGNTATAELCCPLRSDSKWFWHTAATDQTGTGATVITQLASNTARNCNMLINAGPDNTGVIPSDLVTVLEDVGAR